jgi:hypothetical protein
MSQIRAIKQLFPYPKPSSIAKLANRQHQWSTRV